LVSRVENIQTYLSLIESFVVSVHAFLTKSLPYVSTLPPLLSVRKVFTTCINCSNHDGKGAIDSTGGVGGAVVGGAGAGMVGGGGAGAGRGEVVGALSEGAGEVVVVVVVAVVVVVGAGDAGA
jgi:hypothetical protein